MSAKFSSIVQDAMEAIKYQKTTAFGDAITDAITEIRKNNGDDIYVAKLCDVIKNFTKCKTVTIDSSKMEIENAYIIPPIVDPSHPYMKDYFGMSDTYESDIINKVRQKKMMGGVNLVTGEVYGVFAELPVTIVIGSALLKQKSKYSARLVTAIILHEVGHLITIYEAMQKRVSANAIMAALSSEAFLTEPDNVRYEIIHKMELSQNKGYDEKILATSKDKNVLRVAIVSGIVEETRYETGYNIYDSRSCEAVADQYVIRQGYGGELATALSITGNKDNVLISIINILIFFSNALPFVFLANLLIFPMAGFNHDQYDTYKNRLQAIRNGIVKNFKNYNLPEKDKARLLSQIENVDRAFDKVPAEFLNLTKQIGGVFLRIGAGARRERELQITLERLAHSESYLTAAKLEV